MPYLCCTAKVLREFGVKPSKPAARSDTGALGDWHVNLFLFDRRKCLIFVNDRTLLSMIVTGVSRSQIRQLDACFRDALSVMLASELLPAPVIEKLMEEYSETTVAATHDRRVLGSMNDLTFHYTHMLARGGGVQHGDVVYFARLNNRMPILSRPFSCAIDALNGVLAQVAPGVEVEWGPYRMITRLKEQLGSEPGGEVVLRLEEVVPTFHTVVDFATYCEKHGLECFLSPPTEPEGYSVRVHVRLDTMQPKPGVSAKT